jgi:hypothetical protein
MDVLTLSEEAINLKRLLCSPEEKNQDTGVAILEGMIEKLYDYFNELNQESADTPIVFTVNGEYLHEGDYVACQSVECVRLIRSQIKAANRGKKVVAHHEDWWTSSTVYRCNNCSTPVVYALDYIDDELYHYNTTDFTKEEISIEPYDISLVVEYINCNLPEPSEIDDDIIFFVFKFYTLIFNDATN